MGLRFIAAIILAIVVGLAQPVVGTLSSSGEISGAPTLIDRSRSSVVHAQEDDEDDEDDEGDEDEDEDDDEGDEDEDEDDEGDDAGLTDSTPTTPPLADVPLTEVTGTSTGGDAVMALAGERVVVMMFPWMPTGVTLKIRGIDPATVSAVPGARVGSLVFRIEAQDATGKTLDRLPAEVNLSVRYTDQEVTGLSEQNVTLSQLGATDNQWKPAPKLVREATSNYVAASVTDLGTYAVHTP